MNKLDIAGRSKLWFAISTVIIVVLLSSVWKVPRFS